MRRRVGSWAYADCAGADGIGEDLVAVLRIRRGGALRQQHSGRERRKGLRGGMTRCRKMEISWTWSVNFVIDSASVM